MTILGIVLQFLFWLSAILIFHTYIFYFLIQWLRFKYSNKPVESSRNIDVELPKLYILLSVYNEERVIFQKIENLKALQYDKDKINILIGSDCSTDETNAIIVEELEGFDHFHFFPFPERRGKPNVVNDLALRIPKADQENAVLLMTDASVLMNEDAALKMVQHFKKEEIGLVDAHIRGYGYQDEGISNSEKAYMDAEVHLKWLEGENDGLMMGPFGGCFAMRLKYFQAIPPTHLVDDFFLCMKVFEQEGKAILEKDAVCYETVTHQLEDEYARKKRIATGNFQNTAYFKKLWLKPTKFAFAFISHKLLRWYTPLLACICIVCSFILGLMGNFLYTVLFLLIVLVAIILPTIDFLLAGTKYRNQFLKNIRYFVWMNFALIDGYIQYVKGVKNNIWEPTKRYV